MSHAEFENFDSKAEAYFQWWLDELIVAKFIRSYYFHPVKLQLSNSVSYKMLKHKKTKDVLEIRELLADHQYTPDYDIQWEESALGIFYKTLPVIEEVHRHATFFAQPADIIGHYHSVVDVKGTVASKNITNYSTQMTFPFNQKWTYQSLGLYVNKVDVPGIFTRTFCPQRYLITDVSNDLRKLHFEPILLTEFLNKHVL